MIARRPAWAPRRGNCVFWAVAMLRREGGYLAFRRSRHFKLVPHVFWSPDLRTWFSYSPRRPKNGWRVLFDCVWFAGYVEEGDAP